MRQKLVEMLRRFRDRRSRLHAAALALAVCVSSTAAFAQQTAPALRQFAPGVVTTIPVELEPQEIVGTHDLVEVRANPDAHWKPELLTESRTLYGMSDDVKFRRDAWGLEFSFKPLRMIAVDVPQADGSVERKLVWYMVYAVRNTGETLTPVAGEDGIVSAQPGKGGPVRFVPSFVLESQDRTAAGEPVRIAYLDRVIPAAMAAIQAREAGGRKLLDSTQMAAQPIPVSTSPGDHRVWGVATWEDVDPRIDFFSVYVGGLTNSYRWTDPEGSYSAGDPPGTGREFARKTLQLNFWRPGDEHYQSEGELRFGAARGKGHLYGVGEGVAYRWVYR
jgi:hypothetical protein